MNINTIEDLYKPDFLTAWEMPEYYMGGSLIGWYSVIGRHRDSDLLEESNFDAVLTELQSLEPWPEVEDNDGNMVDAVQIHNFGHWAVGWVESIYIHESYREGLVVADELIGKLDDYPVLDDDDYSQREYDDYCQLVLEYWVPDFYTFCEELEDISEDDENFRQEVLHQGHDWSAELAMSSGDGGGADLYNSYGSGELYHSVYSQETMQKMFKQMSELWADREAERKADGWEQLQLIQG